MSRQTKEMSSNSLSCLPVSVMFVFPHHTSKRLKLKSPNLVHSEDECDSGYKRLKVKVQGWKMG